jgi:hypothetical protein
MYEARVWRLTAGETAKCRGSRAPILLKRTEENSPYAGSVEQQSPSGRLKHANIGRSRLQESEPLMS